jgi:hypothetical protein
VTKIYLPSTVKKIAASAFGKEGSKNSVQSATVYYCTLGKGVDTASNYGAESLTWKKTSHQYSDGVCTLCSKVGKRSGTIENGDALTNGSWTFEDGVLTISGEGALPDFSKLKEAKSALGWYEISAAITKIVVEDGITSIGKRDLILKNVTEIVLADSVTDVSAKAFSTGKNGVKNATVYSASGDVLDGVVFAGTVELVTGSEDAAEAEEAATVVETTSAAAVSDTASVVVAAPANAAALFNVTSSINVAALQTEPSSDTDVDVVEKNAATTEELTATEDTAGDEETDAEKNVATTEELIVTEESVVEKNAVVTDETTGDEETAGDEETVAEETGIAIASDELSDYGSFYVEAGWFDVDMGIRIVVAYEASLNSAIEAVKNGAPDETDCDITVKANVTDSSLSECDKNITLDLNGHNVILKIGKMTGSITVKDSSSGSGSGSVTFSGGTFNGDITVEGGTVEFCDGAETNGNITVEGGTVTFYGGTLNGAMTVKNGVVDLRKGVNYGTFNGDITVEKDGSVDLRSGYFNGDITVEGGTVETGNKFVECTGNIIVKGGKVYLSTGDYTKKITVTDGVFAVQQTNSTLTMNEIEVAGGTVKLQRATCKKVTVGSNGKLVIYKGVSSTITELCAKDTSGELTEKITVNYTLDGQNELGEINYISASNQISHQVDSSNHISVTAGSTEDGKKCNGWYLGEDKTGLKLCNRATYNIEKLKDGDTYYASYDGTDQMSITIPEKNSTTMRLQLARYIPDTYKVTLVGIKYSTNKLLVTGTGSSSYDKTEDLTQNNTWGADKITETLLFGIEGTSYRNFSVEENNNVSEDEDKALGNNQTMSLDIKVGATNNTSYVYALGYATVSDGNGRTYTIYTGLHALTLNNTAVAAQ